MSPSPPGSDASIPGSRARALAGLVAVQVLFGTWPVLGKLVIPSLGADGLAVLRISGAALIFGAVARLAGAPRLPWREQPRVLVLSVLGISANQLLYIHGLARTSATHAALLTTTIPVQTLIVALLLGRETFDGRRAAGAALSLLGALVLVTGRAPAGDATLAGDLLVVANTVVYALYLVLSRDLLARWPPLSVLPWIFGWGLLVSLPFTGLPPVTGHPPWVWAALAAIVIGPTVGTYWLNLFALRTVPSSVVAIFIYLQPVVAALLAAPFLGERPTARTGLSAAITFAGVLLASRSGGKAHRIRTGTPPSPG